ncbi:hypothetical protein MTR_1g052345 [Medicago truncatula]|uniref:Uncharacterized protein n=1 Tax=Medicago truncatula TaxID=3880 RepID=A0A072VJE9_MEDTR|nr:hypothetical protein MTR_1g052345 [Medicago truncatula]
MTSSEAKFVRSKFIRSCVSPEAAVHQEMELKVFKSCFKDSNSPRNCRRLEKYGNGYFEMHWMLILQRALTYLLQLCLSNRSLLIVFRSIGSLLQLCLSNLKSLTKNLWVLIFKRAAELAQQDWVASEAEQLLNSTAVSSKAIVSDSHQVVSEPLVFEQQSPSSPIINQPKPESDPMITSDASDVEEELNNSSSDVIMESVSDQTQTTQIPTNSQPSTSLAIEPIAPTRKPKIPSPPTISGKGSLVIDQKLQTTLF